MYLIIDLFIIAIIAFSVFNSARKGFVKVLVEVVGFVLAIIITFTISSPLADITYDKIIEPPIIDSVGEVIDTKTIDNIWDSLPGFISENAETLGISMKDFQDEMVQNINKAPKDATRVASQQVIKPAVSQIIGLLYSIILMIILMFIVKLLAKAINKMFTFSIIGKANRFLGGIIGIPKGIIFAIIFSMIITLSVSFFGEFFIFTNENMEKTMLFKLLADII